MTVGILRVELHIPGSASLKQRRMAVQSVTARLRHAFNVAVSQVDEGDKWQRAVLAVCTVGPDGPGVNSVLSRVLNYIEAVDSVSVIDHALELI